MDRPRALLSLLIAATALDAGCARTSGSPRTGDAPLVGARGAIGDLTSASLSTLLTPDAQSLWMIDRPSALMTDGWRTLGTLSGVRPTIAEVPDAVAVTGCVLDGVHLPIFATREGKVLALAPPDPFSPRTSPWSELELASYPAGTVVDVAAISADELLLGTTCRVVVATRAGIDVFSTTIPRGFWSTSTTPTRIASLSAPPVAVAVAAQPSNLIAWALAEDGTLHRLAYFDLPFAPTLISDTTLRTFAGAAPRELAGFYNDADGTEHALTLSGGDLEDAAYRDPAVVTTSLIARNPLLSQLAAHYSRWEDAQHAVVALATGELWDLVYGRVSHPDTQIDRVFPIAQSAQDISPDEPLTLPGNRARRSSSAGLTVGVEGDDSLLYAVSLNAGIFAATATAATGRTPGRFQQLPASPRYAQTLAIDPANKLHLAVGERDGGALPIARNQSGVWESVDGGASFRYVLDPLDAPATCTSQVVSRVLFVRPGNQNEPTLLAATTCGIARRTSAGAPWEFWRTPTGWAVGAIVESLQDDAMPLLVALLFRGDERAFASSRDVGATWTIAPTSLPAKLDGRAITVGPVSRSQYSLAAVGTRAFIPVNHSNAGENRVSLLAYDLATDSYATYYTNNGDGTGLGGRLFVRAMRRDGAGLAPLIGQRFELLVGTGQALMRARDTGGGALAFDVVADQFNALDKNLHSDLWDAMVDRSSGAIYIAHDGGVSRADSVVKPVGWSLLVAGLHTLHVHELASAHTGHTTRGRLHAVTSDNDAFVRREHGINDFSSANAFRLWTGLGDSNRAIGDRANPNVGIFERNGQTAQLTAFGASVGAPIDKSLAESDLSMYAPICGARRVNGAGVPFCGGGFYRSRVIQSQPDEVVPTALDTVILAMRPLTAFQSGDVLPVPGPLGTGTGLVLARTASYAAAPAVNAHRFDPAAGWIDATGVAAPPNTVEFWVTGGHAAPTYYALAEGTLWRIKTGESAWRVTNAGSDVRAVFVNPYDPNHLFVVGWDTIKVSVDGGATFQNDPTLTTLVTGGGAYPVTDVFNGLNERFTPYISRANLMASVNSVAFQPGTHGVAVAAPYTGVYVADDDRRLWRRVDGWFPRGPRAPVSTVAIDLDTLYVATEGRGLWAYRGFNASPWATELTPVEPTGVALTTNGTPLADRTLEARIASPAAFDQILQLATDARGVAALPDLPVGTRLLVRFAGDDDHAPTELLFVVGAPDAPPAPLARDAYWPGNPAHELDDDASVWPAPQNSAPAKRHPRGKAHGGH